MSDCANWFATIKWADNDKIEVVPVSDIRRFNPVDLNSFQKDRWYRVKGAAKYFNDGQKHSAYALIGCMAESEEDLKNRSSRIRFPPVPRPAEDPASTNSESDLQLANASRNTAVAVQQEKAASHKTSKQKRDGLMFKKFVQHHIANDENIPDDESEDIASLKAQIQHLQRQLQQSPKPAETLDRSVIEYLDKRFTDMQSEIMKTMQKEVEKMHCGIKDALNSHITEGVNRTATMKIC